MSFRHFKLGRLDKPVPRLSPKLDGHKLMATKAPPDLNYRKEIVFQPQMFGNSVAGDCTCAAVANSILGQCALEKLPAPAISDNDVLGLYSAVTQTSEPPGYPTVDSGAFEVDVLKYQAQHGFRPGGRQEEFVGLYGTVEPENVNAMRLLMAHTGLAYIALNLAIADQQSGVWDTATPASFGDPTPGSWGGHAVVAWLYEGEEPGDLVWIATWGTLQRATWRWMRSRMDETHALFHPQLVGPDGRNFAGINRDQLAADMAACGAVT